MGNYIKKHRDGSLWAEGENSLEPQQQGWQMILNNFKMYAEGVHK